VITYRDYLQEIDHLNDQNMLDQVITHSEYLVEKFPNSFEAARFLGQAYLEEKKYAESASYLQKVLACIPDDFVAHVGMSAIEEEKGKIDAALYHMELAFDTQPSNVVVQEELKRLIEKTGANRPSKINLSKGALIRMYIKGDLYQQALNEANACLDAQPERIDIQVLKAIALARSNQKAQATEICAKILEKLPYCYEANKILLDIYLEKGLQGPAAQARERLASLNPYYRFVTTAGLTEADIDDSKVEVDRLTSPNDFFSSGGMRNEPPPISPFTVPLPSSGELNTHEEQLPASPVEQNEQLPDFLSAAGWEKSDHLLEDIDENKNEPVQQDSSPVQREKLPDWLQNFKVSDGFAEKKAPTFQEDDLKTNGIVQNNDDTILSNKDSTLMDNSVSESEVEMPSDTPQSPFPNDESSNWMAQFFDESGKSAAEPENDKDLPDWLKSFGPASIEAEEENAAKGDLPDWLKSIDPGPLDNTDKTSESTQPKQEPESDTPDWLRSLETDSPLETQAEESNEKIEAPVNATSDDIESTMEISGELSSYESDFLSSLDNLNEPIAAAEEPKVENPSIENEAPLPDWVKSVLSTPEEVSPVEEQPAEEPSVVTQDEIPTPVVEVPIKQGQSAVQNEGAITKEAGDELLDWLRDISPESDTTSSSEEAEVTNEPPNEQPEEVTQLADESFDRLSEISRMAVSETHETASEIPPTVIAEESVERSPEPADPIAELNLLDRLIAMLQSANYEDIPLLVSEMLEKSYDSGDILEAVNSFRSERNNDINYLQMLGDTLASFDHFDEALEAYNMAEKLIK
jgi:tetratricopeptide (TPR) repeat protein